jgi:hypothetical protein
VSAAVWTRDAERLEVPSQVAEDDGSGTQLARKSSASGGDPPHPTFTVLNEIGTFNGSSRPIPMDL